jgi:hypothetical protein
VLRCAVFNFFKFNMGRIPPLFFGTRKMELMQLRGGGKSGTSSFSFEEEVFYLLIDVEIILALIGGAEVRAR